MTILNNTLNFLLTIIFQISLAFFLYFCLRILFRQELGWKFVYATFSFLCIFLIAALGSSSLLSYLLQGFGTLEERFVVRDGNSFVVLLMELSLFWAFLLTIPLFIFYLYTYMSASLTLNESIGVRRFLCLFFYLYAVVLFIVDQDLSVSAWDAILATEVLPLGVQFQPDLDFLFLSYRGEWVDFLSFVILEATLLAIFYNGYLHTIWRQANAHFALLACHLCCVFYFFGGEGWLFDISLLCFAFVLFEMVYFQLRVFFYLKMPRTTQIKLN